MKYIDISHSDLGGLIDYVSNDPELSEFADWAFLSILENSLKKLDTENPLELVSYIGKMNFIAIQAMAFEVLFLQIN